MRFNVSTTIPSFKANGYEALYKVKSIEKYCEPDNVDSAYYKGKDNSISPFEKSLFENQVLSEFSSEINWKLYWKFNVVEFYEMKKKTIFPAIWALHNERFSCNSHCCQQLAF